MSLKFSLPFAEDKKKTCFFQISSEMAGGTFFDWGLNYLHGKSHNRVVHNYNYTISVVPIPDNPIDSNSFAHGHKKNHPQKWHDIPTMLLKLSQDGLDKFTSFYLIVGTQVLTEFKNELFVQNIHKRNKESSNDQYSILAEWFAQNPDLPHIFVYPDFDVVPMFWYRHQRYRYQVKNYRDYLGINHLTGFDLDDRQQYTDWDLRELISIFSYNDFNWWTWLAQKQKDMRSYFPNAVHVSLTELFDDQENVIKNLQNRFGWNLIEDRWDHWRETYKIWRSKHAYIDWFKTFDSIIDDIIAGRDCEQDLDPIQEILIEHVLLRRGYGIKNYGLSRFPKNLGSLELEPSLHSIPLELCH